MKIMKESMSVLENLYQTEIEYEVKDDENSSENIISNLLEYYGVIHDTKLYLFKNNSWVQTDPKIELSISFTKVYLEGDLIANGETLTASLQKAQTRIEEELPEITTSTQAYYDVQIDFYDLDEKKCFTVLNELKVSFSHSVYAVTCTNKEKHWVGKSTVNRLSDIDETPFVNYNREIPVNNRYATLDLDPKGQKMKRQKEKPNQRFATLDLNKKNRLKPEFEALLFQQDTQQDVVQTAQQKLGKQTSTQQVSKSIQSQADKMSYQKAYDTVEDAMKAWDDADAYDQYKDTVELASKWYGDNLVLVDSFDIIDKIYYAADLTRKIARLEDDIANTKSRATIAKLTKELDQVKKDLANITPQIQDSLKGAKGYDAVEAKAKELENNMEDYVEDYQSNLSEWKALKGKMEKAGKLIELMEALKNKYAEQYDLPPLLSRYKSLMDTPIPTIMDIESMDTPNLDAVYTAWRQSMQEYRKELESFSDSMRSNYDVLSRLLALKAKSKSLF